MSAVTEQTLEQTAGTSDALADEYWDKGYIALRGLFSADEVNGWKSECERLLTSGLVDYDNLRTRFRTIEGGHKQIERIDPVVDASPLFQQLVQDSRIMEPLRAIWRNEPKLFKDKLIFKSPGMSGYSMHQDQAWWQMCPADDILSVSIMIDGANRDNGCIELFPGYHRSLLTTKGELRNMKPEEIEKVDASKGEMMETQPGDVLIFHSQTPHQSGSNTAQVPRRSLYLSYTSANSGDFYEQHREHYRKYTLASLSEEERARAFFR